VAHHDICYYFLFILSIKGKNFNTALELSRLKSILLNKEIMQNQPASKSMTHPNGLLLLSTCYALFMWPFGYIVSNANLLFTSILNPQHSLTLSKTIETQAYEYTFTFLALLWILPILGGYISQRMGYFRAAAVGLSFCIISNLCLAFSHFLGSSHQLFITFCGLSLFLSGNSLFTPAAWCLVDHLYSKQDKRRESGFTLFYLIFNIGGIMGIFVAGAFTSYHLAFLVCTSILFFSMVTLFICHNKMHIATGRTIAPQLTLAPTQSRIMLYTGTTLFSMLITLCFLYTATTEFLIYCISIIAIIYMLFLAFKQKHKVAKHRVFGFIILCLFATGFWVLYNLEPSLLTVFIQKTVNTNIHIFNYTINIPASSFFGFEGLSIVIIGIFLSQLWLRLANKGKDPNLALKFGLGLLFIAMGYVYLFVASYAVGLKHQTPAILIILSYLFFATGELCVGPLGISMVGKLSPAGKEGTLMGIWQLVIGVSAIMADDIAKTVTQNMHQLTKLPKDIIVSAGHTKQSTLAALNNVLTRTCYAHTFKTVGLVVLASAIIVIAVSPWVKKLLDD
jgi:proton-dependent oligopeptide transporter, POT family